MIQGMTICFLPVTSLNHPLKEVREIRNKSLILIVTQVGIDK